MRVVKRVDELKRVRGELEGSVGFVPTMGALHEGHLSLIKQAREQNDHLIVSIFVNPTQFLEGEDLDRYPRREKADTELCQRAGVDIVFMPSADMLYEADELRIEAPKILGYILEGYNRPGHFDGVLQIVMKLLNLTKPTRAYFGKKDAQQLVLIEQMVRNYFLDTQIVPCEIVRDEKGLALSSRNLYLNGKQKQRALCLSRSLRRASEAIAKGERDTKKIEGLMLEELSDTDRVEYAKVVSRSFGQLERIELGNTILLVAAWVGNTRLIDNHWL